jgi:multidrug efflux system membrane fusion protein
LNAQQNGLAPGLGATFAAHPGKDCMRLKPEFLVAGGILGAFGLYFVVSGLISGGAHQDAKAAAPKIEMAMVQASLVQPTTRPYTVLVRGRTQANRIVSVRSETSGDVASTPVREGSFVRAGQVLCKLRVDARQAMLDQMRADLRSKELNEKASSDLAAKGFRSQTQVLADQANRDQAAAAVRQAEVALNQTNIRAPFSGVFNERDIEVGGYLSPGGACGVVIELDPLKITADASESDIGKIQTGAKAHVVLASGQAIDGQVFSVARDADPQTRTYHVVVLASNPNSLVRSGLSAEVNIEAGQGEAHLVPASALVLDSAGRQGVRFLQGDNVVAFAPIKVLDETTGGVWVSGLSGPTRVITVGQSYVLEGQRVHVASR